MGESKGSNSVLVLVVSSRIIFQCVYMFQAQRVVSFHLQREQTSLLCCPPLLPRERQDSRRQPGAPSSSWLLLCSDSAHMSTLPLLLYSKQQAPLCYQVSLLLPPKSHSSPWDCQLKLCSKQHETLIEKEKLWKQKSECCGPILLDTMNMYWLHWLIKADWPIARQKSIGGVCAPWCYRKKEGQSQRTETRCGEHAVLIKVLSHGRV